MGFDKKYYKQIKAFVAGQLDHVSVLAKPTGPVEHAATFLPLITDCVQKEDYEGAQATKDAIRDFLNRFMPEGEKLTDDDKIRLPAFKKADIHGILCLGDPKDKSGMASGGAIWF